MRMVALTILRLWWCACHWLLDLRGHVDEVENDPTLFLTYLVAALQTIAPTLGEEVMGVLQSPQPPPPEAILTALLNEITTFPCSSSSSWTTTT